MNEVSGSVESPNVQRGSTVEAPTAPRTGPGKASFLGNGVDLAALGALAAGVLVLLTCLTCGLSFYCLPVVPLLLGIIGLVLARTSVDAARTRLWSWIGIGSGGLAVLLAIFAVVGYFFFIFVMIVASRGH